MPAVVLRWICPALAAVVAQGFVPFAGVEELKPRRLEEFCDRGSGSEGPRWCSHSVRRTLDDGGDVELAWRMNVDPSSILSLDTEAEHGVQLTRCGRNELELQLPESHVHHVAKGKFIVASRFAHNCEHLAHSHLYHRVSEVKRHVWRGTPGPAPSHVGSRVATVHVATDELASFAHIAPYMSFYFSYMPVEALDRVPFPEMRTDLGGGPEQRPGRRRLAGLTEQFMDGWRSAREMKLKGLEHDTGGFQAEGHSNAKIVNHNSILNLSPKQVSNFGWNWDFYMNTTQEPEFNVKVPGAQGFFHVKKPFVKVHAGIFLNFTSEFASFAKMPLVNWRAGLHGHGHVQARIISTLNSTGTEGMDPFSVFDLPELEQFAAPKWFGKIEFATANLPVSVQPGFQFTAKLYHSGTFHGAVSVGGKTHGVIKPSLTFNSLTGFDTDFEGTLLDTDIWPPLWMIFTKRFELGVTFKPQVLMRGSFVSEERATVAMELQPYLNISVTRTGHEEAQRSHEVLKPFTVYPFRAMGVPGDDFGRKYKVVVTANGQSVATSPEINWGHVSFHDHVSKFNVGGISQKEVLEQEVTVTLIEVDDSADDPGERTLGSGSLRCTSLLDGVCHPAPSVVHIKSAVGTEVAYAELMVVWHDNPEVSLASKIRGVSMSFPQIVLRKDALESEASRACNESELSMHLFHGGRTFRVGVEGDVGLQQASLSGDRSIEFGPIFLESWAPCGRAATAKCESPKLELYCGVALVASNTIPEIDWTSQTAMRGARAGGGMDVPVTTALYAPGVPGGRAVTVAVVRMSARIVSPAASSSFMAPRPAEPVALDEPHPFVWTVSGMREATDYTFTLSALRLMGASLVDKRTTIKFESVNNDVLVPIPGIKKSITMQCQSAAMTGSAGPCRFTHLLRFGSADYAAGDRMVLLAQWSGEGTLHSMWSPPFEITAASNEKPRPPPPSRRLWSQEDWNARVAENQQSCDRKNLHFSFGAGMLMRGMVLGLDMPGDFPVAGGADEAPQLTTGFRTIAAIRPGSDAQDLLPGALCQGGLCQGALPGCTEDAGFRIMHFPTLKFDFNRPFHYKDDSRERFHGAMRHALAYAFSALPEMVDIAVKELNESGRLPGSGRRSTTTTPSYWAAETTTSPPQLVRTTAAPSTVGGAFSRWWSGAQRRLSETPTQDQGQEESLEDHQVVLRFKEGVPFRVDRALVDMMLHNGYFMEVDDDASREKGTLRITNFYIDDGPGTVGGTAPRSTGAEAPAVLLGLTLFALATAVGGVFFVAAAARRHTPDHRRRVCLAQDFEPRGSME